MQDAEKTRKNNIDLEWFSRSVTTNKELSEQSKEILNSTALLVQMISDTQKLVGRCLISLILLVLMGLYILTTL